MAPQPTELLAWSGLGRCYEARRRVRLGDVDRHGRLRLDALARYLQDVSDDDVRDSGYEDPMGWVARRTIVVVDRVPRLGEQLTLATFCSGLGPRWAERRVSVTGEDGAGVEAGTLWVHLDLTTMAPRALDAGFLARFGPAAAGRTVRARLQHEPLVPGAGERRPWIVRATDLDVLGHVNNAAYWAAVEEVMADRQERPRRSVRGELEFRAPVERGTPVELVVQDRHDGFAAWIASPGTGAVYASAVVHTLA